MTFTISSSDVYQALSQVKHPEFQKRNLVELRMISEVFVDEAQVRVVLALHSLDAPFRNELVDTISRVVIGLAEGMKADVHVKEMDSDQRSAFHSTIKKEFQVSPKPSAHIRQVLAVMSGKGGVGKSSVTGLLASSLHNRGYKVGVLDADITGPSIPKMFGVHEHPIGGLEGILPVESRGGIKLMSINLLLPDENQPVVWRGPLISRAIQQFWSDIAWGDLDVLIVDLPPGTSDASLTVTQSLPLDGILLVTSPQDLAGMVVRKAAIMAMEIGARLIGLVENMSYALCPECGTRIDIFGVSRTDDTARSIGTQVLGHIPLDARLSTLCDTGEIESYYSEAFEQITDRVIELALIKQGEPVLKKEGE
jgi:Mrp family chromosome partitioning ATPase